METPKKNAVILSYMIQVGDTVPLSLQLFDGKENMSVMAAVLDPDLNQLAEIQLQHVQGGLYISRQFIMPNVSYVIAHYVVYDGEMESEEYERASDVFYSIPPKADVAGEIRPLFDEYVPKKDDYLTGQVVAETVDKSIVEGKIDLGTN